jgi:N-acetylglucosaminyl-diphospho-decaprenol L-rhamnosyltransferase
MPELLELSVIIVNWNSAEFVRRCIRSIRQHTTGLICEIIVIDNASYDGCDKVLQVDDLGVTYLQSDRNLGFAKANNLAFETSRGTSLLFLNPDTEVVGPAILTLYRALHQLPAAGVVGARLLNHDGSLQKSCIQSFPTILNQVMDSEYLVRKWPRSKLWGMAPLYRPTDHPEVVEMISGACLMLKREVFQKVGRFSEDYFMYTEDADLCYKVSRAGWKNYYVPEASVVHFGGGSSKQAVSNFSAIMMRESIWRFLRKTRGNLYGAGYRWSMLLVACCRLGLLGFLTPLQRLRRQPRSTDSFRKWWAILRWSVCRQGPMKQYETVSTPSLDRCQVAEALK